MRRGGWIVSVLSVIVMTSSLLVVPASAISLLGPARLVVSGARAAATSVPLAGRHATVVASAQRSVIRGQQVVVRGAVKARRAGAEVQLQRKDGRKWTVVARGRTSRTSRFVLKDRPLSGRSAVYRARAVSAGTSSVSPRIRVRLRSGQVAVARHGTVLLKPRAVTHVTGDSTGNRTVSFARSAKAPAVGSTVVVPPVEGAPEGWIGVVLSRQQHKNGWEVRAKPATLADAYSELTIATSARGSAVSTAAGAISRRRAVEASCKVGGRPPRMELTPRLDSWDFDLVMDVRSRTLRVDMRADATVDVSATALGAVDCSVTLPVVEKVVGKIGYVPIIASIGPTAKISASSAFTASGEVKLRLSQTIESHVNRTTVTTSIGAGLNRPAYTSDTTQTVSVAGGLHGSVSVAKMAGLSLSLTGKLAADIKHGMQPDPCFVTSYMGNAGADFDGKAWGFVGWKFNISERDFGRRELSNGCRDVPAPPPPIDTWTPGMTPTSGPAGTVIHIRVVCPTSPTTYSVLRYADPDGSSWTYSISNPGGDGRHSQSVQVPFDAGVGSTWKPDIECRSYTTYPESLETTPFQVTSRPDLRFSVTRAPIYLGVSPPIAGAGQAITITDGGGCPASPYPGQNSIIIYEPGNPQTKILQIPIGANGRWGPIKVTVGPQPQQNPWLHAECRSQHDGPYYGYPDVKIWQP